MLRATILVILIAIFAFYYRTVLFSRAPLLGKLKRIPVQTAVFAILVLSTINGFRGSSDVPEPQASDAAQAPDVETTAAIASPPPRPEPLRADQAAAMCLEQALTEAQATDDLVAQNWMSSVEGYIETAPDEVTLQFAIGPRIGSQKGAQCRSEARLTCRIAGRDVRPRTPMHMTGAQISC